MSVGVCLIPNALLHSACVYVCMGVQERKEGVAGASFTILVITILRNHDQNLKPVYFQLFLCVISRPKQQYFPIVFTETDNPVLSHIPCCGYKTDIEKRIQMLCSLIIEDRL